VVFIVEKAGPESAVQKTVFVMTIICMLAAFLLSLWAANISTYEGVADPKTVIHQFGDTPMKDEQFFDNRIADYTVAHARNAKINDRKAVYLAMAGYALLIGISLHALYFILRTPLAGRLT
jgi:hypothetical protein